jgi:hypothetical protein
MIASPKAALVVMIQVEAAREAVLVRVRAVARSTGIEN